MAVEFYGMWHSPYCRSVKVLAKLIGVDINNHEIDTSKQDHMTPEFTKMNPFNTIPTIVDDGFTLCESRAVLMYLAKKYAPESGLYPKDLQERALVDAMLHYDAGNLSPAIISRIWEVNVTGKEPEEAIQAIAKDQLERFNEFLSTHKYVAGRQLTIADISINHTLMLFECMDDDLSEYVHLWDYMKRVREELGTSYSDVNEGVVEKMTNSMRSKRK